MFYTQTSFAAESISLDKYESDQGIWRLGLNTNYTLTDSRAAASGGTVLIQVSPGEFVQLPTSILDKNTINENLSLTPSASYGITKYDRLALRTTFSANETRIDDGTNRSSDYYQRFDSAWLSLNHTFKPGAGTIRYAANLDVALAENTRTDGVDLANARSWLLGATFYSFYDPLVMFLSSGFGLNLSKTINDIKTDPGDFFFIAPSVAFIPNQDAELSFGFVLLNTQATKLDGHTVGLRQTHIDMNIWYAYAWSTKLTLSTNLRATVSGAANADIGLSMTYDLDR